MKTSTKNPTEKTGPKLQVKDSLCGLFTLGVIVAESIAAYVLYFSGNSNSLKVVAGVLVVDAGFRATKAFMVVK